VGDEDLYVLCGFEIMTSAATDVYVLFLLVKPDLETYPNNTNNGGGYLR